MERRLDYQIAGADITKCRQYRYSFWIIWDESRPSVMFIGLNPAIADGNIVNPIHERCMDLSRRWGYGGLHIANLFAFRSQSFEKLRAADDPVGGDNNRYLLDMQKKCAKVIVAWGPEGSYLGRDREVLSLIEEPYCLGRSVEGHPIFSLDADNNIEPVLFRN